MTTSRATIRSAVAGLLTSGLSLPSGNVMEFLPGAFRGATPVVLVLSSGSGREPIAYALETQPVFFLDIKTYVLMGAKDGTWSSDDTEAKLDAIEAGIAGIVQANARHALWNDMQYAGRSKVEDVMTIDGFVYRRESIPVRVECDAE